MPDYNKTIIYKLINYDYPNLVYVGSTTNFNRRKSEHKHCVMRNHTSKVYTTINEYGGWDAWEMVKICDYPCQTKIECLQEEDRQMMLLKSLLNSYRPHIPEEEKDEYMKEQRKQYYEDNKDCITEKHKQYYEAHRDFYLEYQKQYREDNKDCITEKQKQYYEAHSVQISAKRKEKVLCECGCYIRHHDKASHKRSNNHLTLMSTKTN